jgi:hypothetical protein
VGSGEMLLKIL